MTVSGGARCQAQTASEAHIADLAQGTWEAHHVSAKDLRELQTSLGESFILVDSSSRRVSGVARSA